LKVIAKTIYLLTFYPGLSMNPGTVWIISGLRSRRKNVTAPAAELFFSWTWLQLRSSLFHGSESSSGFCSFSHINTAF